MLERKKSHLRNHASRIILFVSSLTFLFIINIILLLALSFLQFSGYMVRFPWWEDAYAIASNILISCFVSFVFFFLLVYVPESRRRKMLRQNALSVYRSVKRDILRNVLAASIKGGRKDLSSSEDVLDKLMHPHEFRERFEKGSLGDEGFYAFANQMSDETYEFIEIVNQLKVLSHHLNFLMHNFPFRDERLFGYVTRLEQLLLRIQTSGAGYDESKPLCRYIYQVYAGWDWVSGYTGYDPVEKSLRDL